jgi:hypothetical protein
MPSEDTKRLLEDLERLKETTAELRWSDDTTFEKAVSALEGRPAASAWARFEEQVWRLLQQYPGLVVAREPSSPSSRYRPDFLARAGDTTLLVEVKASNNARDAAAELENHLADFGADRGLVVLPVGRHSNSSAPGGDNKVDVIPVDQLESFLRAQIS